MIIADNRVFALICSLLISNLNNPELSNKVCRETKRLNRSINLIGLIESKNDAAGITSKGFSVCSLRSDQTPTALRYSGFSSLDYCFNEIKKAISTIASYIIFKKSDAAGIRTPNLLIRSQVLYPVKLQRHWIGENTIFI